MKLGIDKNSPAVYKQIETSLRKRIRDGQWVAGTMLPSRRDLAKEFGVSSVTVERAITRLIADGILRADDRRGTFVTETPVGAASLPAQVPSQIHLHPGNRSQDRNAPPAVWPVKPTTIGIVASLFLLRHDHLELNNFWVRLMVQSLEHSFSADGQTTRFFNRVAEGQGSQEPLNKTLECALGSDVDALVVIAFGMNAGEVDESLGLLGTQDRPVVCITSGALNRPVPHVFYNNHFAGYQAAQYLIKEGANRIIYFSPFSAAWVQERKDGVKEAMSHSGLSAEALVSYPESPGPWVQEEDPQALGYRAGMNLFQDGSFNQADGRSGIICANDGVAFGVLQAAVETGLRQGVDFSLVSFDDHPQSRAMHLTTLRPPMEQMGQEAARILLAGLHGEEFSLQVCLRGHLIPRST